MITQSLIQEWLARVFCKPHDTITQVVCYANNDNKNKTKKNRIFADHDWHEED